jgi:hypothetical protein
LELILMALNLSINLADATFADLAAIVEAARQAGAVNDTAVTVRTEGDDRSEVTLSIVVDEPTTGPSTFEQQADKIARRASEDTDEFIDAAGQISDQVRNTVTTGSDAALRLIAELLKGGPNDNRRR